MEKDRILRELTKIFTDVLDNPGIILTEMTTAEDVAEWDSLHHIQLVVAIEKHFKIRFSTAEIRQWRSIGDLCNSLSAKLGGSKAI